MIVMPANVTSPEVRSLMAEFPDMLGNLFSPGAWQVPHGIYALDNGRFSGRERWSDEAYLKLLDRAARHPRCPEWALVPDVVADWSETLREWNRWERRLRGYGWPLAVAVQDGSEPADVYPLGAQVVFVGGSTRWKLATMAKWCDHFPRVHVARANTVRRLLACADAGAESVDGTGWMQTTRQRRELRRGLRMLTGREHRPLMLWRADGAGDC